MGASTGGGTAGEGTGRGTGLLEIAGTGALGDGGLAGVAGFCGEPATTTDPVAPWQRGQTPSARALCLRPHCAQVIHEFNAASCGRC